MPKEIAFLLCLFPIDPVPTINTLYLSSIKIPYFENMILHNIFFQFQSDYFI